MEGKVPLSSGFVPTPPVLKTEIDAAAAMALIDELDFDGLKQLCDIMDINLAGVRTDRALSEMRKLAINKLGELPKYSSAVVLESTHDEFESKRSVLAQFAAKVRARYDEDAELIEKISALPSAAEPFFDDLRAQETDDPPRTLVEVVEYLLSSGAVDDEGLFRIEGLKTAVDDLYEQARFGERVDFSTYDVHVVTNFLKRWMRNLREPLFTYAMYAEFAGLADEKVIELDELKALMKRLPPLNFNCLAVIFKLLAGIAANSEVNRMDPSNLSRIWSPNLLSPDEEDPIPSVEEMARASRTIEAVIVNYEHIFGGTSGREDSASQKQLNIAERTVDDKHCTVVVCGDMSSGKSTFLNLMMEAEVLPNAAARCTGAICEVVKPKDPANPKAYFYEKDVVKPKMVVPMPTDPEKANALLNKYTTVENMDDIYSCEVEWNHGVVEHGLRLVDTPGLNDRRRLDRRVKDYLPSAVGMIVILNLDAGGLTRTTKRLVRSALSMGLPPSAILFVGSKVDRLSEDPTNLIKATKKELRRLIHHRPRFAALNIQGAFFGLKRFKILVPALEQFNETLQEFAEEAFLNQLKKAHGRYYGRVGVVSKWYSLAKLQMQLSVNKDADREYRCRRVEASLEAASKAKASILKDLRVVLNNVDGYLMDELDSLLSGEEFKNGLLDYLREEVDLTGLGKHQAKEVLTGEMRTFTESFLHLEMPEIFENKRAHVQDALLKSAAFLEAKEAELNFVMFARSMSARPIDHDADKILGNLQLHPRLQRLEKGGLYKPKLRRKRNRRFARSEETERFKRNGAGAFIKHMRSSSSRKFIVQQMFSSAGLAGRVDLFFERLIGRHNRELELLDRVSALDMSDVQRFWGKVDDLREWLAAFKIGHLFDWNFDFTRIKIVGDLGDGAFGAVKLVRYKGENMAMKMMTVGKPSANKGYTPFTTFDEEYEVLRELGTRKAPVVRYHGATVTYEGQLCLLMELCSNGDLASYIIKNNPEQHTRLAILVSAAKSLKYIHDHDYIHRDVKGGNFLLTGDLTVKACDLGLAGTALDCSASRGKGTPLFMAPEMIPDSIPLSGFFPLPPPGREVDIFSFGMVILQVLSGSLPYSNSEGTLAIEGMGERAFYEGLHEGTLPVYIPPSTPESIKELICACILHNPEERPRINEIIDTLQAAYNLEIPALPGRDRDSTVSGRGK